MSVPAMDRWLSEWWVVILLVVRDEGSWGQDGHEPCLWDPWRVQFEEDEDEV